MPEEYTLFTLPVIETAAARRRVRTAALKDGNLTSRKVRIEKRNRVLIARYYYWTELKRRRFDDVIGILSDQEFFVEERTISNALLAFDSFLQGFIKESATPATLKKMFPSWDWTV